MGTGHLVDDSSPCLPKVGLVSIFSCLENLGYLAPGMAVSLSGRER